MAGLKETIFNDNPIVFWSFDEDRAGFDNGQILDEMNNQHPLTIHGTKYTLEGASLNDIEPNGQYSVRLAEDGCSESDWSDYNTYFSCPHTTAFDFTTEFTVEFMYYKTNVQNCTFRDTGRPGAYKDVYHPIIRKGDILDCRCFDDYSSTDQLYAKMFGRYVRMYEGTGAPVWNSTNHVVITFKVTQTDVNEFQSTIKLYVNGRLRDTDTATHVGSFPQAAVGDSWFVGGTSGSHEQNSYNTELMSIDQVAVYNYAFNDATVSDHFRKTQHYIDMIKADGPEHYWRLDELDDPNNRTLYDDAGGIHGYYFGQVDRHRPGPDKLIESRAVKFEVGASAVIDDYGYYGDANVFISINDDYTLEFWFKSVDSQRGLMFALGQENPNFNGLYVWLNSKDNVLSQGNIQIAETRDNYVNSLDTDPTTGARKNWNDGEWHHIVVRRTNSHYLQLILDGELNNEQLFSRISNSAPSQVHLAGYMPGDSHVTVELSELAFYQYNLSDMQIANRWNFTSRFVVSGYTLLQGQPIQATVRFYDHITGNKIDEVNTDTVTGEYSILRPTNRYVDIMAFIPDNNTTRYRVHGPVKPAEFNDSHL